MLVGHCDAVRRRAWRLGVLGLALVQVLGAAGCAARASLSRRYKLVDQEPELAEPVTIRFALIGDNQSHHVFGDPGWLRTGFADKVVREAIRAVQLDLFGQDLLRWVMTTQVDRIPVIHLGDAADLSCRVELDRFAEAMRRPKPWFITPGNHDGFFLGTGYNIDWDKVCRRGGGKMEKADFVRGVLELLKQQLDPGAQALAASSSANAPQAEWRFQGDGPALLRGAAWKIDATSPWRSYLLQEIDLTAPNAPSPVRAFLVDTSQPLHKPSLLTSVGSYAEIGEDQFAILQRWVGRAKAQNAITILMGHHPYHYFTGEMRKRLDRLREKGNVLLYVSAHDHKGAYLVRGRGTATWLELNVGSVLDWPVEYRTFQISTGAIVPDDPAAPRELYVRTPRFTAPKIWLETLDSELPACDHRWQPQLGDPDFYVSYTEFKAPVPDGVLKHLVNVGMHSFVRLLTTVPSAATGNEELWPVGSSDAAVLAETRRVLGDTVSLEEKTEWLQKLDTFDRKRKVADELMHRNFRLCQAYWASQDDAVGARVPDADQWFVVFGKE